MDKATKKMLAFVSSDKKDLVQTVKVHKHQKELDKDIDARHMDPTVISLQNFDARR